jgi:hypothetical protein
MNHTRQPYTRDYRRRLRADYDYVVGEVRNALPVDAKILQRPQVGFIGWRLGDERFYFYFGPYNEITYRLLIQYAQEINLEPKFFPKWFSMIKIGPHPQDKVVSHASPQNGSELSFHKSELSSIKGSDLVRFVGDCFRCERVPYARESESAIYRWPLFFAHLRPRPWRSAHWRPGDTEDYPWDLHYAWTVLGKIEQTKREQEYIKAHPGLHDPGPARQVET